MRSAKPKPPLESDLLSEIEANLRALGISPGKATFESRPDIIFNGLVQLMQEKKSLVSSVELARYLDMPQATVHKALLQLASDGRLLRSLNRETGRACFVPNVIRKGG